MRIAESFASASLNELEAALDGGKLVVYSTGRPPMPDHAVTRSAVLVTFIFGSPAFVPDPEQPDGLVTPNLVENPVVAVAVGTPSFARIFKVDGTVVADLSAGPGPAEVKLNAVSTTPGHPIVLTRMRLPLPPEKVEWDKTDFGHVFITNNKDPHRRLSVRG